MTFAEEVAAYRFRLLGPRFRAGSDGRYRLPRAGRGPATVLESPQLVLETNNVALGAVEAELKAPLRELSAISSTSTLACGAVVNAAVRHMPDELAFVSLGVGGDGFMFLAGMLGNDRKACIGIDDFGAAGSSRDAFRARFDARRSPRHAVHEGDYRDYLGDAAGPGIGVLLLSAGSYERQLDELRAAEPRLAEDCVVIAEIGDPGEGRQATLDFPHESRLPWRVVLDERTAGAHPTLGDGLIVLQAGSHGPLAPIALATETRMRDPVEVAPQAAAHPPLVTVLHYRNPWVGAQDYPNLEVFGLNPGRMLADAFEASTGDYIVALDPDVELTPDAISEAVRKAHGGPPAGGSTASRLWGSVSRGTRGHGGRPRRHLPVAQAEYFPSWSRALDDGVEPQTVTVARALSVSRDNLIALDLDPRLEDPNREIAVRFAGGLELDGPAARVSRVPDGVVAGRVGAVLTPDGRWLVESVGAVARAWPALALDDTGEVELTEAPRASNDRVATIACELRRDWWTARYGHWTFDVLTRAAMLLRAGIPDDVKLLVPEPVVPWQRRTLAGLGIAKERIVPWDGRPTRFREVYVPTARAAPPFLFPAAIELLREFGDDAREAAPARRLFVSRRQLGRTTRIANEDELLDVAVELDFVKVMPETLPFSEQLRLFAEAEVVAGPHGSGLANAVYMARGTGLCELAPARLHAEKVPNFWNLAACGGQRYGVCVAGSRRVDPKRFRRVLREVIQAVAPEHIPIEPVAEGVTQPA